MLRRALVTLAPLMALALGLAGCDESLSLPLQTTNPAAANLGAAYDPQTAGTIVGQVRWSGPLPAVPPFEAPLSTGDEGEDRVFRPWANPHAPAVDGSGGVGGAVVFLRGVDPDRARPWDLPPVQVEMKGGQFHVGQGASDQRAGFLRPGDTLTMVSHDPWFEILQAREAVFFSVAFAEPGPVRTRQLQSPGHVELISGAGHFWMRGHLFVVEHPYYTNTDATGRFMLPQVPPGKYELVCWHPNWHTAGYERDNGTLLYIYLTFDPPLESVQSIEVEPGRTVNATFALSAAQFEPANARKNDKGGD